MFQTALKVVWLAFLHTDACAHPAACEHLTDETQCDQALLHWSS